MLQQGAGGIGGVGDQVGSDPRMVLVTGVVSHSCAALLINYHSIVECSRDVSCGGWHTLCVDAAGRTFAFGRGEYGRLGIGDDKSRLVATQVESLAGIVVVQVAAGGSHSLFLSSDGKVFTCGRGGGRLGLGTSDSDTKLTPHLVAALSERKVTVVSAGGGSSASIGV